MNWPALPIIVSSTETGRKVEEARSLQKFKDSSCSSALTSAWRKQTALGDALQRM